MANGFLNGLISYWKSETPTGGLVDEQSVNALSYAIDFSLSVAGKAGQARDNIQRYASKFDATLDFRVNPMVSFTTSHWVKFNNAPQIGGSTWLMEAYDANPNEGWGIVARGQNSPDDWAIFYATAAATQVAPSNTPADINAGQWYHVVAGYDAVAQKLFIAIDGDYLATSATVQIKTAGNVAFTVGGWEANGLEVADAAQDEICVWDRALTEAEILTLYAGGTGVFFDAFDSGAVAGAGGEENPNLEHGNEGPLFSRVMEVTSHLLATPLDSGDAALTVAYRQVPL